MINQKLKRAILVNVIPPEVPRAEAEAEFGELVRLVDRFEMIKNLETLLTKIREHIKIAPAMLPWFNG